MTITPKTAAKIIDQPVTVVTVPSPEAVNSGATPLLAVAGPRRLEGGEQGGQGGGGGEQTEADTHGAQLEPFDADKADHRAFSLVSAASVNWKKTSSRPTPVGAGLEDGYGPFGGEEANLLGAGPGHFDPVRRHEHCSCPLSGEQTLQPLGLRRPDAQLVLGPGGQRIQGVVGDEASAVQDDHAVHGLGDLGQDVAGDEHGAPFVGQAAKQIAQPSDALGVEAIGRFVEDQDLGVAQERRGEPEALAHPEGELADSPAGGAGEIDEVEDFVDPIGGHLPGQGWTAGPAGGCGRCGPGRHLRLPAPRRPGGAGRAAPGTGDRRSRARPLGRLHQTQEHSQRGGFARPVGTEETDHRAGVDLEAEMVDGGQLSETFGEVVDFDHRHWWSLLLPGGGVACCLGDMVGVRFARVVSVEAKSQSA